MAPAEDITRRKVEDLAPAVRRCFERSYQLAPEATHRDLVNIGYWLVASQLKIDHAAGRLVDG